MPRGYNDYSFVIDSSFQPFSMQEMLVPFAMYKDEFEKQEAMLDELSKNTDTFKYLEQVAKDNPESKAAQIYNTYASDLRKYGDDFSANGLSMANSRGLRNMKRRYQGEIGRLAKIDEIRRAQIKEQNELRLKDPTRLFSRRADLTDLDKYLENPDLGYESYSGALLAQQVGTAASAIAKGLRDYGKGKPLDGFTKTWLQQHGYTAAEVAQAIQNPALDKTGVLNSIVEQAVQSSGLPQWADASTLNQAYQYARQGLWNAVGQTSVSAYTDEAAKLAAQEAMQKRVANYSAELAARHQQLNNLAINPINIYSRKELDEIGTNMRDYAQYFTVDAQGRTKLNEKGIQEYNRNAAPRPTVTGSGSGTAALMNAETQLEGIHRFEPTKFRQFIDNIGGADYVKNRQYGLLGNLWNQYNQEHKNSKYDATKSTEYDFNLDPTQQAGMKNAVITAGRGSELREVDFDRETNTFKPTGGSLSMEDFNKDDYTIISTRFSPYGSTIMVKDKAGKVHRYAMPKEINPVNEAARDQALSNVSILQKAFSEYNQNGYYTDATGNHITPTPIQLAQLQAKYQEELQKAYLYHSQIGLLQNKMEEQKFNPYGF